MERRIGIEFGFHLWRGARLGEESGTAMDSLSPATTSAIPPGFSSFPRLFSKKLHPGAANFALR
jgi:hypothetical protein